MTPIWPLGWRAEAFRYFACVPTLRRARLCIVSLQPPRASKQEQPPSARTPFSASPTGFSASMHYLLVSECNPLQQPLCPDLPARNLPAVFADDTSGQCHCSNFRIARRLQRRQWSEIEENLKNSYWLQHRTIYCFWGEGRGYAGIFVSTFLP